MIGELSQSFLYETAQIVYTAQKVVTISTDYAGGVGAPDYKSVVGESLLVRQAGQAVLDSALLKLKSTTDKTLKISSELFKVHWRK